MRLFFSAAIIAFTLLTGCEDRKEANSSAQPVSAEAVAPTKLADTKSPGKEEIADCCKIRAAPQTQPAAPSTAPAAQATPTPGPATKPAASSRVSAWTEPAQRPALGLDYDMTDQDGKPVKLTRYLGKPAVVSFFFTRCSNPQMCPLIVFTMGNLQRDLAKAGLDDKVSCALISYDPVFDTAERVKTYGEERGFNFKQGAMLSPSTSQFREFINDWELSFGATPDGQINHKLEMMVLDKSGKLVREYHGEVWNNAEVVKDVQRLLAEP